MDTMIIGLIIVFFIACVFVYGMMIGESKERKRLKGKVYVGKDLDGDPIPPHKIEMPGRFSSNDKAREFVKSVMSTAVKYGLPVFVVTDGASGITNDNCEAVDAAREAHVRWEQRNGVDSGHDWGLDKIGEM